jgi:putative methionine-R-sulfoxide reductase with GAF domain
MHASGTSIREYAHVTEALRDHRAAGDRRERMRAICDALWDAFGLNAPAQGPPNKPVRLSWVGFYSKTAGRDEMILEVRRDKPACSPLGLEGCCGRCWKGRRPVVVRDVRAMEGGYIACDPKDLSEVVVPLFEPDGSCWGVLDIDSYEPNAFDANDATHLTAIVESCALSAKGHAGPLQVL